MRCRLGAVVFVSVLVSGCSGRASTEPLLEITPPASSLVVGQSTQLLVTRHFPGGPVETVTRRVDYVSSNRDLATVDGAGIVTAGVSPGLVVLHVFDPNSNAAASATITVLPQTRLEAIRVTPNPLGMKVGQATQLSARGVLSDGSEIDVTHQVAWTSSSLAVVVVDANGVGTAGSVGTAAVTATGSEAGVSAVDAVKGSTELDVLP